MKKLAIVFGIFIASFATTYAVINFQVLNHKIEPVDYFVTNDNLRLIQFGEDYCYVYESINGVAMQCVTTNRLTQKEFIKNQWK